MTFAAWLRNISQSRVSSSYRGEIVINAWNEWAENATKHEGSFWLDWADHLKGRSGKEVAAPKKPGSRKHQPLGPAPGTYVFEP